ncbi:MAG TPA: tetraacyldisaccharide 4'-kinase, partial [Hyphomicrobiales bacterium]|nr:tetraacyldisaccharide 4'-kinase [Hyphomicrobiales bacterium]
FLTRGFGGRIAGPHLVDPARDGFAEVGDEALLLARAAPTVVARKRPEGAQAIEATGASIIIMDDGFQNPSLAKDLSLIAVDAGSGIGNGLVFPAGPLRASLGFQKQRADAVVFVGEAGEKGGLPALGLPAFHAALAPASECDWLQMPPVLAFCGIGRPQKFFDTLKAAGATLADRRAFPDHHAYTDNDAGSLLNQARTLGAQLVTTEKDWVRLNASSGPLAELKSSARTLPVELIFSEGDRARIFAILQTIPAPQQ